MRSISLNLSLSTSLQLYFYFIIDIQLADKKEKEEVIMIIINKRVQDALAHNQAVVALESTIISHGMPYPTNVKVALQVEDEINSRGAIAATIGIIDGDIVIGMTAEQIEEFGTTARDCKSVRTRFGLCHISRSMGINNSSGDNDMR